MTKLSDTQVIILSAAAQRADGNVLPLPGSLRGGAATKVVAALLSRGLIREHVIDSQRKADAAMNTVWRNLPEPDGRGVLLFITAAGTEAIGVEPAAVPYAFNAGTNSAGAPAGADEAPVSVNDPGFAEYPRAKANAASWDDLPDHGTPSGAAKKAGERRKAAPTGADVAPARKSRGDTKQAQLIAMLRRKEGATIAQIVEATNWQPHTVRGAFAGALKKKLGLTVTSEKIEGGERIYRLEPEA